jgi:hypothetical protein
MSIKRYWTASQKSKWFYLLLLLAFLAANACGGDEQSVLPPTSPFDDVEETPTTDLPEQEPSSKKKVAAPPRVPRRPPPPPLPIDPRLVAGATFDIPFARLPLTYGRKPSVMRVRLPDNFRLDRRFPVIVYLSGGWGHVQTPSQITEHRDYVWVSVPIYKYTADWQQIGLDDVPLNWTIYTEMFNTLTQLIPNLATTQDGWALGGFSNGGHLIGALLAHPVAHQLVMARFNRFYFFDGLHYLSDAWHTYAYHFKERETAFLLFGPDPSWVPSWANKLWGLNITAFATPGCHCVPSYTFPIFRAAMSVLLTAQEEIPRSDSQTSP